MRKRIIVPVQQETASADEDWLNVENLAEVEITSENVAHPIESALLPGRASGWRAGGPGQQTIRLYFADPQRLQRIRLNFVERLTERNKSTSCVDRRMAGSRSEKSCGSSGISAPRAQLSRRKIITSSSRVSLCWS